jgi:putative ABC transport system permease protein
MRWLPSVAKDLNHAIRSLAKARAFTVVCVGSLGLGMGTVIAILMLMRAMVGTPEYLNTDGLVELLVRPEGQLRARTDGDVDTWTYPDFVDLARAATGMSVAAWTFGETIMRVQDADEPQRVPAMYVTPNYFTTIGVPLSRGSGFQAPGARAGQPLPADLGTDRVVIIEHDLWQNRLGGRPDIVGSIISLNRVPHVVVGVTLERFRGHVGPEDSPDVQLWVPLSQHPRLESLEFNRETEWIKLIARLSPGLAREQAQASASVVMSGLARQHPATNHEKTAAAVEPYHPMGARSRDQIERAKLILFGLSGMVLFIVCLNVSGMMLVRAATRQRELSVRLALGASRARLVRYILSEAFVIASIGGLVAMFIIFGIPAALLWYFDFWHRDLDLFRPTPSVYLMCAGLSFVTTAVFGLVPAIRFSRPNLITSLKDDAGGGGRRVGRLQKWTAAIQAGVAVPFLVIGAVKLDQVQTAAGADVGFEPIGIFAAPVDLSGGGNTDVAKHAPFLLGEVTRNLNQATGVTAVAAADGLPLDFRQRTTRLFREGDGSGYHAHTTRVSETFFDTLGIRVVRGRGFRTDDRLGAENVVVLSQPLAAKLFPGEDALGERLLFEVQSLATGSPGPNRETLRADAPARLTFTVVGVTDDVVTSQMGTERPQLFLPLAQHPPANVVLIARATAADSTMAAAFKNAVATVDPDFAQSSMVTGARLIQRSVRDLASHSILSVVCAGVALLLAALGVYGVVGFMVATRTREIGVRMALGATRPDVLRSVLADAVKVVVPGVVVGLALAIVAVRVGNVPETWYDLGSAEPLAYAAAAAVALAVATIAGLPSARRATKINPIVAMRAE